MFEKRARKTVTVESIAKQESFDAVHAPSSSPPLARSHHHHPALDDADAGGVRASDANYLVGEDFIDPGKMHALFGGQNESYWRSTYGSAAAAGLRSIGVAAAAIGATSAGLSN